MPYWKGLSNASGDVFTGDLANRFKVPNFWSVLYLLPE